MRMHVLVVVTCALLAVVAVVAWPGRRAAEPAPRPGPPEEPARPRIESATPDPALDEDAAADRAARVAANEADVEALLRQVVLAQARFQARGWADADGDGVGEYAKLGQLAGLVDVREGTRLTPPLLPKLAQGDRGRYERAGYYVRLHLAGDTDLAETTWCCYAWPVQPEAGRTYFVNQFGDVLVNEDSPYGGDLEPAAAAAYIRGSDALTGDAAVNAKGNDGAIWRVVR